MFRNLLKYSIRALQRQKSYVLINTIGLSVGIACSMIITLFIIHELSYDQFHEKKDRLYRIILHGKMGGQEVEVTSTASVIAPTMLNEFPEVEDFLRMNGWSETVVHYKEKNYMERSFLEADSSFFNFFSIPLIHGDKKTVLNKKHTVVLSESLASKIFGKEYPVDKMIRIGTDTTAYRITGVYQDIPENTHFRANMIASFMTNPRSEQQHWISNSFESYVLLHENANTDQIDQRFEDMIIKYVGPLIQEYFGVSLDEFRAQGNKYSYYLQPLLDIHLNPAIEQSLKPAHDPKYLWIFGSVALLIIIIASVNFMNLSTAQSTKRAKEVGIKKVSGSSRRTLIGQFLTESIILSLIALVFAIIITYLSLPYFNDLINADLHLNLFQNIYTIPALLMLSIFIGLLAGSYPAFYISSFNPYMVLKGALRSGRHNGRLRSVLVVLQFSISIALIVGTAIMFRQLKFMSKKDLGFDKEQVLVLSRAGALGNHMQSFKDDLLNVPGIMSVSASTAVPGRNNNNNGYKVKGREEEGFLLQTSYVDFDFLKTYGMKLASGRFFDPKQATDKKACLLNEQAVKHYQFDKPFEERFIVNDPGEDLELMPVIGVVKNFHYESLQSPIGPYLLRFREDDVRWGYVSVRLEKGAGKETVEGIEEVWGNYTAHDPMQYFFIDKDFERLYREEKTNAEVSTLFSILGILIAALGLYGLTAFSVQLRTKEIGVRKTFGASVSSIWMLISKEILKLVGISTLIAWPLIYWGADHWLQHYHYRIDMNPLDFLIGLLIAAGIALATTSFRVIKTASVNPAKSLRTE